MTFSSIYAYGGGWTNAHATFNGGSDASGTIGMHHFSIKTTTWNKVLIFMLLCKKKIRSWSRKQVTHFTNFVVCVCCVGGACGYGNLYSQGMEQTLLLWVQHFSAMV